MGLGLVLFGCAGVGGHADSDAQRARDVGRRYGIFQASQFPEVPDLLVEDVQQHRAEGKAIVLVDVREPRERAVSTLPGAISVEQFERQKERYRSSLVVPYCTIGLRSGLYGRQLIQQGFRTRNLKGSVLAWAHAGLALEHGGRATRRVHVYSRGWNLLPRGYEAVYD
ncbi:MULTISPECIES: rhodanese-like domain-containing protein [Aphanothece]|uniref:rhodanese-like domain-containing protein n=1 Tax=Aphanothece TaxID=1121 RepID=UPI0039852729